MIETDAPLIMMRGWKALKTNDTSDVKGNGISGNTAPIPDTEPSDFDKLRDHVAKLENALMNIFQVGKQQQRDLARLKKSTAHLPKWIDNWSPLDIKEEVSFRLHLKCCMIYWA